MFKSRFGTLLYGLGGILLAAAAYFVLRPEPARFPPPEPPATHVPPEGSYPGPVSDLAQTKTIEDRVLSYAALLLSVISTLSGFYFNYRQERRSAQPQPATGFSALGKDERPARRPRKMKGRRRP